MHASGVDRAARRSTPRPHRGDTVPPPPRPELVPRRCTPTPHRSSSTRYSITSGSGAACPTGPGEPGIQGGRGGERLTGIVNAHGWVPPCLPLLWRGRARQRLAPTGVGGVSPVGHPFATGGRPAHAVGVGRCPTCRSGRAGNPLVGRWSRCRWDRRGGRYTSRGLPRRKATGAAHRAPAPVGRASPAGPMRAAVRRCADRLVGVGRRPTRRPEGPGMGVRRPAHGPSYQGQRSRCGRLVTAPTVGPSSACRAGGRRAASLRPTR